MSDDLPDDLQRLLASERARPEPLADELTRIREATEARLQATAGDRSSGPTEAPRRGRWLAPRSLLVGAVVGAIVGHLATRALQRPGERVAVRVIERVLPVVRAPGGLTDAGSAVPDASVSPDAATARDGGEARPSTARSGGASGLTDRGLAAERALIERCSSALVRGDASGALVAAREHVRRFRNGALVEEREALTIQALRSVGRMSEADARAEAFLRRWPASLHGRLVRGARP